MYTYRERICTPPTLLADDAAVLVNPFAGEGILFAIISGRLAAGALFFGHPECYQCWVDRRIGATHKLGLLRASLFYRLPRPCFDLSVRNPFVRRALVEMLNNQIGYGRVLPRLFGTLKCQTARFVCS